MGFGSDPKLVWKGGYESKIKQKHWLIITNNNEDVGQDDYEEDLEWMIEHSPDCPYEVYKWEDGNTHKEYKCLVGSETDHNGVDGLEFITGTGDGWRELEPGRYEIEAWSEYHPPTPNGGGEWDGGLRFVDP
jgi:hypothetical protein